LSAGSASATSRSPRATWWSATRWWPSRRDPPLLVSQRTDRLDSQIRQELMDLLQREMKDPRLGFATITRVETARDLGHARVFVSVLGSDAERERTMSALRVATPWLRRKLGERLSLRHVPELSVREDDSIASGDRVLQIINELDLEPIERPSDEAGEE
jgi:ribosome-binding factor A